MLTNCEIVTHINQCVDLSVSNDFYHKLLPVIANCPMNIERSRTWIHSSMRAKLEKIFLPFLIFAVPTSLLARALVYLADDSPTIYRHNIGLSGTNNETVSEITIYKVRTLKPGAAENENIQNETPAAFRASRKTNISSDSRVHSWTGKLLRETGLDETPQSQYYVRHPIGPRGYTLRELEWIKLLLTNERLSDKLPVDLTNYQAIISKVRPLQGAISLRNTIPPRGNLTITERLITDLEFARRDCLRLDWNILTLSISRGLKVRIKDKEYAQL